MCDAKEGPDHVRQEYLASFSNFSERSRECRTKYLRLEALKWGMRDLDSLFPIRLCLPASRLDLVRAQIR